MEGEDIKLAFSDMLKVKSPWRIKEIKIYDKNKVVDVYIDYEEKSRFAVMSVAKCVTCMMASAIDGDILMFLNTPVI